MRLARRSCEAACTAPAVFNAANEVCVDAFHERRIGFLDILDVVVRVLDEHLRDPSTRTERMVSERALSLSKGSAQETDVRSIWRSDDELTLERVLAADAWARERARELTMH